MDQAHYDRMTELEAVPNRDANQEKELSDIRELSKQDEPKTLGKSEEEVREEKKANAVPSESSTGEQVG